MRKYYLSPKFWAEVVAIYIIAVYSHFLRKGNGLVITWIFILIVLSIPVLAKPGISLFWRTFAISIGACLFLVIFPVFMWLGDGHPFPKYLSEQKEE